MQSHFANIKTLNLANINKIQHKCSHHGDNLAEDCQHSHNRIHTKIILNFDKAGFEKIPVQSMDILQYCILLVQRLQ